jgi:hypothetical protein
MQGLYKASKLFSEQSRLLMDSRRDLRPLKQNCSANLERIESNNHFFCYTSGRWLYNEPLQLKKRYVRFNVPALQQIAGRIASSRCVEMTKIPEGLYNKVFSLRMENGREILARIPNPNAGHPQRVVASEVATLDFVRNAVAALLIHLC